MFDKREELNKISFQVGREIDRLEERFTNPVAKELSQLCKEYIGMEEYAIQGGVLGLLAVLMQVDKEDLLTLAVYIALTEIGNEIGLGGEDF